jgi:ribosomal protein S18 acetylase RimI-like enzyme
LRIARLQGKGYGRAILTAAIELLPERQRANIRLSVVTDNAKAVRLYQSVGFENSSEYRYYLRDQ